jgi:small subunit ribosomal protein S9
VEEIRVAELVQYYGTGRRKSSTARVYLRPGTGLFKINRRDLADYFKRESLRLVVHEPFNLTETNGKFDVMVTVDGGGTSGQAGAVKLGISRALLQFDAELRKKLKPAGLLTRDARIVERKKYGQPGARKRFQYSKR